MGYFLTLLYVAMIFLRPQEFITDMQGWPIIDVLAALSVAAVFLEGSFQADKFRRSVLNKLVLTFWGCLILSQIANLWFGGAVNTIQIFGKVIVVYFLIVLTVDTWPKVRLFTWMLVWMALFLAANSVYMYYTGAGLVGGEALMRNDMSGETAVLQARGIGIFADPNDMALNMVPMVAFLLPTFHRHFLSRSWLPGVILLVPMVAGIAYTRSRGGILGLAAVSWFYLQKRVGTLAGVFGLLLVLSFLMAIPRMGEISTQETSARSRLDHWSYGLDLFKSNPLFGVGMGRFTERYHHTAHNSFILVIAEAGFLGGFVWVAMFWAAFRDIDALRRDERAPPSLESALDAIQGALMGWLVCAFFLSQAYKFLSFLILGLLVAVMNAMAREGISVASGWRGRDTFITGAVTAGGIVFMHLALRVLWHL